MRYFLENEKLKIEVESFGAELKSAVDKESLQEYMWEADPAFWGKTSPVLFPFIGKLEGAGYLYQGKRYGIEKHGFARDMEFSLAEKTENALTFFVESNAATLQKFPFAFRLEISYRLQGNTVLEAWKVLNTGNETMYFSMGGHPAFACPPKSGKSDAEKKRTDCFLKLYTAAAPMADKGNSEKPVALRPLEKQQVNSAEISVPDGFLTGASFPIEVRDAKIPIVDHIFDQDALCLVEQNVLAVALCDASGKEYVRLEADCPVWGIWSVPDNDAAYVCLEPWWGICDSKGYTGTLEERPFTNVLEADGVWEQELRMIML